MTTVTPTAPCPFGSSRTRPVTVTMPTGGFAYDRNPHANVNAKTRIAALNFRAFKATSPAGCRGWDAGCQSTHAQPSQTGFCDYDPCGGFLQYVNSWKRSTMAHWWRSCWQITAIIDDRLQQSVQLETPATIAVTCCGLSQFIVLKVTHNHLVGGSSPPGPTISAFVYSMIRKPSDSSLFASGSGLTFGLTNRSRFFELPAVRFSVYRQRNCDRYTRRDL